MIVSDDAWKKACTSLKQGDIVSCTVTSHHPFGMLVLLNDIPVWGLIERFGMAKAGYSGPSEYPPVGSRLNAIVAWFREPTRQVELVLTPKKYEWETDRNKSPLSVEVGVRFSADGTLEYFGQHEVNRAIEHGRSVQKIEAGRPIHAKSTSTEAEFSNKLIGFSINVILD